MNRKLFDLPYVGRMRNLDSTGFTSRLGKWCAIATVDFPDYSAVSSLTQQTMPENSLSNPSATF